MGWGYPKNAEATVSPETFDGRLLFHTRRDKCLTWEMEYQFKSLKDPLFLDEWCSAMLVHVTMSYGVYNNIVFDPSLDSDWDNFIIKHPEFRERSKIYVRDVIKTKLLDIRKNIISAYVLTIDKNGKQVQQVNRSMLTGVYEKLLSINNLLLDIDYLKKMDLPESKDRLEKATSYL